MQQDVYIWAIALLSILFIILRPFKWLEAVWATAGALLLVAFRLVAPGEAFNGVAKGLDVYLFLAGMMLLSEIAREEKLFDWLAAHAVSYAKGSSRRLFFLVYGVGTVTTIFLSNDATAVVLTPAVIAATRAAGVRKALPYLLVCAFIANAASFVLPVSNPANIVLYGGHTPPLLSWIRQFGIPSLAAIAFTCAALYYTQRRELGANIKTNITVPGLSPGGKLAAAGILVSVVVLLTCSALDLPLGIPTAITGVVIFILVVLKSRSNPLTTLTKISWSVLPLVAGLFVIVEGLNKTGTIAWVQHWLENGAKTAPGQTAWAAGLGIAFFSNIMNNLPAGLIAADALHASGVTGQVQQAVLIGVDLGPNLSVTGSLATILWLVILRKEGEHISAGQFLRIGWVVMVPALLAALAALWL